MAGTIRLKFQLSSFNQFDVGIIDICRRKSISQEMFALATHLRFKQAQPKMCHAHRVENRVDIFFLFLL